MLTLVSFIKSYNTSSARSHAIEMVFVFIVTGHVGSSARSFMLSQKMILLMVITHDKNPKVK